MSSTVKHMPAADTVTWADTVTKEVREAKFESLFQEFEFRTEEISLSGDASESLRDALKNECIVFMAFVFKAGLRDEFDAVEAAAEADR